MRASRRASISASSRDSRTKLLLHFNGSNGSTSIIDSSLNANAITAAGDAKISTAQSVFSGASIAFDGNGDYIYASNSSLAIGTNDFKLDLRVYPTSISVICGIYSSFLLNGSAAGTAGFTLLLNTDRKVILYASEVYMITTTNLVTLNAWNHIAVIRIGSTVKVYVNGVLGGSATMTNNLTTGGMVMGRYNDTNAGFFTGYIDETKLAVGNSFDFPAADFTPPATEYAA